MFKNRISHPFSLFGSFDAVRGLMISIIFLLNLNYTFLRSARNTLAVGDLGGSAASVPYFELFGVLPAACLMTWILSFMLRRHSLKKVFCITVLFFLSSFVIFAVVFYPKLHLWQEKLLHNPANLNDSIWFIQLPKMTFYVLAELWKPACIHILFWGLINLNTPLQLAKKIYPSLLLGASLGSILAGPVIVGCTSEKFWKLIPISASHWHQSFVAIMILVSIIGIITVFLYFRLCRIFDRMNHSKKAEYGLESLAKSIMQCCQSKSLRLFGIIILADYIAYSLGEVLFLEILKNKYPDPVSYCRFQGYLAFWSSGLTVVNSLILAPFFLRKYSWVVSAMVLPIVLLLIEGVFFIFLRAEKLSSLLFGWTHSDWIGVVVVLGSLQYCACRAIKYTFFDCSKELAFTSFPKEEQVNGKLIIDGICARLGRGGASALSLTFIGYSGGILASSFITGVTAIGIVLSWIFATQALGNLFSKKPSALQT